MTIDEFIDRLIATNRKWSLYNGEKIRTVIVSGEVQDCPISAVTGVFADFVNPIYKGIHCLGLSDNDAMDIVGAADNTDYPFIVNEVLRARLLKAVGLG